MSSDGEPGLLLVLSAPSGAGKTTLAHGFLAAHADATFSISVTTRAPRGAERDGIDYRFVTPEAFTRLVSEGAFAEWAEVHGNRYGTPRATVEDALAAGRIALFDIDVQGGARIKAGWPRETATVFLVPPSVAELERRLRGRSTDSEETIRRRLSAAHEEAERGLSSYEYVIVNDTMGDALARLDAIVAHERAARGGRADERAAAIAVRCRRGVADVSAWTG